MSGDKREKKSQEPTYNFLCQLISAEKPDIKSEPFIKRFYALPAHKILALSALHVLKENKHSLEDALKMLEQRPNLIPLINAAIEELPVTKFLQTTQNKTNEQLGVFISSLEKFSGKKQESWWIFTEQTKTWQKPVDFGHIDLALSLEGLSQQVIQEICLCAPFDKLTAQMLCELISYYRKNKLTEAQLRLLVQSEIDASSWNKSFLHMALIYELLEISDRNFKKVLSLTLNPTFNSGEFSRVIAVLRYNEQEKIIEAGLTEPLFELFCSPEVDEVALLNILYVSVDLENVLKFVIGHPGQISYLEPLIRRANDLKADNSLLLQNLVDRSNEELEAIKYLSDATEELDHNKKDYFETAISMKGLKLPEVRVFIYSIPTRTRTAWPVIEFIQTCIDCVEQGLLPQHKLADFLAPFPVGYDEDETRNLINCRKGLLLTSSWMVGYAASVEQSESFKAMFAHKDLSEELAKYIVPKQDNLTTVISTESKQLFSAGTPEASRKALDVLRVREARLLQKDIETLREQESAQKLMEISEKIVHKQKALKACLKQISSQDSVASPYQLSPEDRAWVTEMLVRHNIPAEDKRIALPETKSAAIVPPDNTFTLDPKVMEGLKANTILGSTSSSSTTTTSPALPQEVRSTTTEQASIK